MQIYLARNNEQAGPYTLEQVNQMLANGQIVLTDLAWHQGMAEWKKLGELTGGKMVYQPAIPAPLVDPVQQSSTTADIWEKRTVKPAKTLATINKRVLAKIIDSLLLWIPASFIFGQFIDPEFTQKYQAIAESAVVPTPEQQEKLFNLLATVPHSAYWIIGIYILLYFAVQAFLLAKNGQTVGKKAMNIQIVDEQTGEKASLTRSFLLRSIVFILINYFVVFFIIVDFAFIFTARHRTLHDRLARTVVVDIDKTAP